MSNDPAEGIDVVYDGECPFCSRFMALYRIRERVKRVRLIDARSDDPLVREIRARGLDLDEGMVVRWDGRLYHGAEAMHVLGMLGSDGGAFNWLNNRLFRHPRLARALYPHLVRGRRLTLTLLGRKPIAAGHGSGSSDPVRPSTR